MKKLTQISAFLLVAVLAVLVWGCNKENTQYSTVPHLDFGSYEVQKTMAGGSANYTVLVHLNVTDGDGDIGLSDADTLAPYDTSGYYYNLIANYYEHINGQFRQLTKYYPFDIGDTINYNGRLPILTPESKHKGIQADVEYSISMGTGPIAGDAIKFKFWIYDRALHKSNVVESPEIVLN